MAFCVMNRKTGSTDTMAIRAVGGEPGQQKVEECDFMDFLEEAGKMKEGGAQGGSRDILDSLPPSTQEELLRMVDQLDAATTELDDIRGGGLKAREVRPNS